MRGGDARTEALFSYLSCEARVPMDHRLRAIRKIVNAALTALSPEFEKLYAKSGRPSIPPEKLLRALLLQAFYSVRSERQLMEQLDYNLLFREADIKTSIVELHHIPQRGGRAVVEVRWMPVSGRLIDAFRSSDFRTMGYR